MRLPYSLLVVLFLFSSPAVADVIPERPSNYVVDLAGVIDDSAEARLNAYLMELEQKTSAQFVVLGVRTLDGLSVEDLSLQVAENWRLGRKGKDNGILMVFAVEERRYRFEVGYGLEGILPDSRVGSIGREYIVPFFRQGDYTSGVSAAVLAISEVIADESGVELKGVPGRTLARPRYGSGQRTDRKTGALEVIFAVLILAGLVYMFIRHPRLLLLLLLFSGTGGRRSGWGGGGFGGGGFGGFGGGGGGGFGGGGASGSW